MQKSPWPRTRRCIKTFGDAVLRRLATTCSASLPSKTFLETPRPPVKRFAGAPRAQQDTHFLKQRERRGEQPGAAALRRGPGSGQSGERKGERKPGGITSASSGQQGESFAGKQGGKVLLWGCSRPPAEEGGGSTCSNRPSPSCRLSRGSSHPGAHDSHGTIGASSPKQDPLGRKTKKLLLSQNVPQAATELGFQPENGRCKNRYRD